MTTQVIGRRTPDQGATGKRLSFTFSPTRYVSLSHLPNDARDTARARTLSRPNAEVYMLETLLVLFYQSETAGALFLPISNQWSSDSCAQSNS